MIDNKWAYVLNSLAWTVVGAILTLVYQHIFAWLRERRGQKAANPFSPQTFFAVVIIMIALASAALSGANQVAFQSQQNCQSKINQSNVSISNERARRTQQDTDNLNTYLDAQDKALLDPGPNTISDITSAYATYKSTLATNNDYRNTHTLVPLSRCK